MDYLFRLKFFQKLVARNLRLPEDTIIGRMVKRKLIRANSFLERNAVLQCNIQPSDHVLEIGFGPGIGLQYAVPLIKGDGKLYGVDISPAMFEDAKKRLHREVASGKVELFLASVMNLPFNTATMNKVFHCNCFYFWPNLTAGCKEIHRVLKPGGLMITTINLSSIKEACKKGYLKYGNPDVLLYMQTLENVGFRDVNLQYINDSATKQEYQCVYATASNTQNYISM